MNSLDVKKLYTSIFKSGALNIQKNKLIIDNNLNPKEINTIIYYVNVITNKNYFLRNRVV